MAMKPSTQYTKSSFVAQIKPVDRTEERLFTILMARASSEDTESASYRKLIDEFVTRYGGNLGRYDLQSFIATFDGPSRAAHCSLDLVGELAGMGVQLTVGIHITVATKARSLSITHETAYLLELMLKHAKPNQVMVTQTIKSLLSGAGLSFILKTTILESGFGEAHSLFAVNDPSRSQISYEGISWPQTPSNNSFLENIIQCINAHLNDPAFGVEMLCREIGISDRHLLRKLNAITNKSPNQLISSVRLHRAKEQRP